MLATSLKGYSENDPRSVQGAIPTQVTRITSNTSIQQLEIYCFVGNVFRYNIYKHCSFLQRRIITGDAITC